MTSTGACLRSEIQGINVVSQVWYEKPGSLLGPGDDNPRAGAVLARKLERVHVVKEVGVPTSLYVPRGKHDVIAVRLTSRFCMVTYSAPLHLRNSPYYRKPPRSTGAPARRRRSSEA